MPLCVCYRVCWCKVCLSPLCPVGEGGSTGGCESLPNTAPHSALSTQVSYLSLSLHCMSYYFFLQSVCVRRVCGAH